MNIVLYGNGGSGNHGCEAIARGTIELLKGNFFIINSNSVEEDTCYGLNEISTVISAKSEVKKNLEFMKAFYNLKVKGNPMAMDGLPYIQGIHNLNDKNIDFALSVGGDNYCYNDSYIYHFLNKKYNHAGMKTVLWGCSVEPKVLENKDVVEDMSLYSMIVARESITYQALSKVNKNTVLMPDPAFYMIPKKCNLDPRFQTKTIGINVSPMIVSNEKNSGITLENYKNLIQYILSNTSFNIALIPHVVWNSNDDRTVLNQLYEMFDKDERIILVEDHTAPELKYIISQCFAFVGARTHSTIAAYSSEVPTLVVGYSVKARGIAKDLFGTEKDYVLPVQELREKDELVRAFQFILDNEEEIRNHLHDFLPGYLEKAQDVLKKVKEI